MRITQFVDFCQSLGNSSRIILTTNGNNLHEFFWIVEIVNLLNGLAIDILFMSGWQQNGKGEVGIMIDGRRTIQQDMPGIFPYKKTQTNVEDSLYGHQCCNKQKEHF